MSTAFLVSLMILVPALAVLSYFAGYRAGLEDQTPPDKLPCGHKRNPHQWGKWAPYGEIKKRGHDPNPEALRVVGIVQSRTCERCEYQEFDDSQRLRNE